jgi:hypothetical protein
LNDLLIAYPLHVPFAAVLKMLEDNVPAAKGGQTPFRLMCDCDRGMFCVLGVFRKLQKQVSKIGNTALAIHVAESMGQVKSHGQMYV